MENNIDLYEILKVSKDCSPEDLKKSYKKLCLPFYSPKFCINAT